MTNRVSIKTVIAKVLADNDMQEDTLRINDLIEWCAEAISRIGAFLELDNKVTGKGGEPALKVANHQAALPAGVHSIIQVAMGNAEEGPFMPMRMTSGNFDTVKGSTIVDNTDPLNPIYTTGDEVNSTRSYEQDLTYTLKPGYINTSAKEGYLTIAYRSIPLDPEGFPYMPDDHGFEDAVYWYLTMKLLYPKWVLGQVRDAVYYNARQSWNYYSKQAYGNSMMPSVDMMESIKNTWNRLIPEMGEHAGFFSNTGQRQEIYNQTNLSYATNRNSGAKWWH